MTAHWVVKGSQCAARRTQLLLILVKLRKGPWLPGSIFFLASQAQSKFYLFPLPLLVLKPKEQCELGDRA